MLDYNVEFKTAGQVSSFYAPGPYRSSDHDPVIVGFDTGDVPKNPTSPPNAVAPPNTVAPFSVVSPSSSTAPDTARPASTRSVRDTSGSPAASTAAAVRSPEPSNVQRKPPTGAPSPKNVGSPNASPTLGCSTTNRRGPASDHGARGPSAADRHDAG